MAIEAKLNFISRMQKEIGGMVTADAMPRIMSAVSDLLDGYEMREIGSSAAGDDSDMLNYYLGAMKVQGRSTKTIERYEFMLKRMLRGVSTGCRMITVHHLRAFLAQEKARGLQDSTLEGMRQIYSAFFGWLHREGLIDKNPIANLGPIKVAKKKRMEYTAVELERLHEMCRTDRDRAILAFLETTGCRVSEMTGLDRDALDLEHMDEIAKGQKDDGRTAKGNGRDGRENGPPAAGSSAGHGC